MKDQAVQLIELYDCGNDYVCGKAHDRLVAVGGGRGLWFEEPLDPHYSGGKGNYRKITLRPQRKKRVQAQPAPEPDDALDEEPTNGDYDLSRCPGCNQGKAPRFKLCKACYIEYGPRAAWPAWLTYREADNRRFRHASGEASRRRLPWGTLDELLGEADVGQADADAQGAIRDWITAPAPVPDLAHGEEQSPAREPADAEAQAEASGEVQTKKPYYVGNPGLRTDPAGMAISRRPTIDWQKLEPWPDKAYITGPDHKGTGERVWRWRDRLGAVMLPYRPYDNEDQNQAYRRANGISPVRTPPEVQRAADQHALTTDIIGPDIDEQERTLAENLRAYEMREAAGLAKKKPAGMPDDVWLKLKKQREALGLWLEGKDHTQDVYHDRRSVAKKNKTRTYAEIGRLLGISRQAARERVNRALARCEATWPLVKTGG